MPAGTKLKANAKRGGPKLRSDEKEKKAGPSPRTQKKIEQRVKKVSISEMEDEDALDLIETETPATAETQKANRAEPIEVDAELEPAEEELEQLQEEVVPARAEEQRTESSVYGDTAFHLYLREIGHTKLLTPGEEVVLAKRIQKGDKEAREQMIKANLRLVVKIARDYEGLGLPLLDLINEGNIGLMKGVERFDPSKGAKLSTYAAWWIKQSIKRALANQSKTIRLPVHVVDKLLHIRRAEAKLHDTLGREPTDEEIGQVVDLPARRVAELRKAAIRPASLEAPLSDDQDSKRVSDLVPDERAGDPYSELSERTQTEMIREMVASLSPREAEILRYRFGLDGEEEKTLEEVGEKYGVTRERIRQIQEMALKKLRRKIEDRESIQIAA